MGAILALDFGSKRLGVSVSDRGRDYVFSRPTLLRTTLEADHRALGQIILDESCDLLVVGLPLNADGSEGPMAQAARQFAAALSASSGIASEMVDERYTSIEADESLKARFPRDTRKRRSLRDQVAASLILKTFLEHGPYRASP